MIGPHDYEREPVAAQTRDHVRRPDLPWRESAMTECGRPTADVKSVIERDVLLRRLEQWGKQRTSLFTCMVCWETAARWPLFDVDPVMAMHREFYGGRADPQLAKELRALAALATAYREDFEAYMAGLGQTVELKNRRRRQR